MQRSQALILDFDGTILDTEWPIFAANNELYAEFGLPEGALTVGSATAPADEPTKPTPEEDPGETQKEPEEAETE